MKKLIPIVLAALVLAVFSPTKVSAQEKKTVEAKAVKVDKSRGVDDNIKTPRPTVDTPAPKPDQSRGGTCKVIVDNWTGFAIDIYVDGEYAGTVGSWSDGYTYAIEGKVKLYGASSGGGYTWGPTYVDCVYEHTWKLTN